MNDEQEIESTAQAAAGAVQEERKRRRRAEAQPRRKRPPLDSPVLAVSLTVVLVVFTALNLSGNGLLPRTPEPTEAQLLQSLDEELELLGLEIEAEMELTGEVPELIEYMVAPAFESWSYQKLSADSYRLSLTMDGLTRSTEVRVTL